MEKRKASFSPLLSEDNSLRSSTDTDVDFSGQTLTYIDWKTYMFKRWYLFALLFSIVILILTIITLIILVIFNQKSTSNQKLAIQSSVWCKSENKNASQSHPLTTAGTKAPLIEADVVEYQETTWNNAFSVQNIYRGPPNASIVAIYPGPNSLGTRTNLDGFISLNSEILSSGIITPCSVTKYKSFR